MTWFEFGVTYAVCWWLVLFMVLPHQAQAEVNPGTGHAKSAPANPQIKRKIRWATLWAILPAVAMYFIVTQAKAAENMLHAGNGCKPLEATASADLNAKDGYSTGGKTVKPATLPGNDPLAGQDNITIPLVIPVRNYIDRHGNATQAGTNTSTTTTAASSSHNVDLSESFIDTGDIQIGRDGSASLNGKKIASQETLPEGCDPGK